jgi:hypothetical protein
MTVLWDIVKCSLVELDRSFRALSLMMEAVFTSETLVIFYETIHYCIPGDCHSENICSCKQDLYVINLSAVYRLHALQQRRRSCRISTANWCDILYCKKVKQSHNTSMVALGGRGGVARTHSRPRY